MSHPRKKTSDAAGFYARRHGLSAQDIRTDQGLLDQAVEEYDRYMEETRSMRFYRVIGSPHSYVVMLVCASVARISSDKIWFQEETKGAKEGDHFVYRDPDGTIRLEGTGWMTSEEEALKEFRAQIEDAHREKQRRAGKSVRLFTE